MSRRGSWATRLGFYLAAIGSACGLGNLWRFPYIVGENGGGAFVLLYVFVVFAIGLPLLIGELILGKLTGKSVISALGSLEVSAGKRFFLIGRASLLLSLLVLSYYAVISGWVLHFSVQFFMELVGGSNLNQTSALSSLMKNGYFQVALASVHLLFCVIVVIKGVQEGMEKFIGWVMPLFGLLLVALIIKTSSLSSSVDAVRFLFYPDFSKLKLSSLGEAIGHVFFTLSVGFGVMVTFGSYFKADDHVPTAAVRVAVVDTLISLAAGMLIFPIALQASNVPLTDPRLLFETLPGFLLQLPGGAIFGFMFFICLYLAAISASIGLMEVIVANIVDRRRISRQMASWLTGGVTLIVGFIPAFSGSVLAEVKIFGRGALEAIDALVINWALPVIALGMCWAISRGIKHSDKEALFVSTSKLESVSLFKPWRDAIRYFIPAVIVLGLLLQLFA